MSADPVRAGDFHDLVEVIGQLTVRSNGEDLVCRCFKLIDELAAGHDCHVRTERLVGEARARMAGEVAA